MSECRQTKTKGLFEILHSVVNEKKKMLVPINIHYALSTSYNFCVWIKF